MKTIFRLAIFAFVSLYSFCGASDLKVSAPFGDHMVFQQKKNVPIWGTAASQETIQVEFGGQKKITSADAQGNWIVTLDPMPSNTTPQTLKIIGAHPERKIKIEDILIGEVWLCSGQSNMQWTLGMEVVGAQEELKLAHFPHIRWGTADRVTYPGEREIKNVTWSSGTSDNPNLKNCSAIAWYFAKKIHLDQNVPIGILISAWGGTPAEAWIPISELQKDPQLQPILKDYQELLTSYSGEQGYEKLYQEYFIKNQEFEKQFREKTLKPGIKRPLPPVGPKSQIRPGGLFETMVEPYIHCAFRGVLWYQGEHNAANPLEYYSLLPTLIQSWREASKDSSRPFVIIQLPLYNCPQSTPEDSHWAILRDAMFRTWRKTPNTGMAVSLEYGEIEQIHPKNKAPVGERAALAAKMVVYDSHLIGSGPAYKSSQFKSGKALLTFDFVGKGLNLKQGGLSEFTIAGKDQVFHPAQAVIEGNQIVVSSSEVPEPQSVRYAWKDLPTPTLYNVEGLPASPFRTDDWQIKTVLGKRIGW